MRNKSILNIVLDVLKNGCVIFTVIIVLTYIAGTLFSKEETLYVPDFVRMIIILVFSFILSGTGLLLSNKKILLALRLLLHFATTTALFFIVVVIGGGYITSGAQTLIAMALYIIFYAIFATIYGIITAKKEKKKNKKENYKSMFN